MRNRKTEGFTLIELLIVIAIIGILAAVLIPNLLNARSRAFDTAAQTCLRELSTQMEVIASNSPFTYNTTGWDIGDAGEGGVALPNADPDEEDVTVNSCVDVVVTAVATDAGRGYTITGEHLRGNTNYTITNGTGVVPTL